MAAFDDLKLGCIVIREEANTSPLPLEHTAVNGTLTGAIASVTVTQRFGNPFKKPIELEYLFPLPHEAAVVDYEITIGTRTIKAELKEREAAQRAYQEAVQQGKRASLLEQRRPNLFAIEIGNVQPGESIVTRLVFEDRLTFEDGAYEFVFPMGITPRYHQPSLSESEAKAVDAPLALDENKVSPVEIALTVDAGVSVSQPASRTHKIKLTKQDERRFNLTLDGRQIPNKDFVLRYEVSTDTVRTAVWDSADADAETVLMMVLPPRLDLAAEPAPREFIFVIDRSGSMQGEPMMQAKNALRSCLRALGTGDTFYIQAFDDHHDWFDGQARQVTQDNVNAADAWLENVDARGGTEILPAIDAALALPVDKERQRYVVFLTDGAVSADDTAIGKIARQRGSARIFTFGIGPSVNRYLLDKMADLGRGKAEFIGAGDDIETTITRFQDRVSYPALLDVALAWQNAETWDTYPEAFPDVYAGSPLEIITRLKRRGDVTATISGTAAGKPVAISVPVPAPQSENPTLKRIHARARIEALLDKQHSGGDMEKIRQQVISLAIEHRLITPFTSFVAIDSEVTAGQDAPEKIRVSVPLPEGLQLEGFVGGGGANAGVLRSVASYARGITLSAPMAAPPPAPKPAQQMMQRRYDESNTDIPAFMKKRPSTDAAQSGKGDIEAKLSEIRGRLASFDAEESDPAPADAPEEKSRGGGFLEKVKKAIMPEPENRMAGGDKDEAPGSGTPQRDYLSGLEAIKWLARTQNVDGSWHGDNELTAAALIAFVRAGHTTRAGSYRRHVAKAMHWLQIKVLGAKGFAFYATLKALSELQKFSGDGELDDLGTIKLPPLQSEAERAARGDPNVVAPDTIQSLNDLRLVALVRGTQGAKLDFTVTDELNNLVQIWMAVGAPRKA